MTTPNKSNEYEHLGEPEPALIHGRLHDVNPELGTAILDAYVNWRVPLRFDASLGPEMLRLEAKFVKVSGRGKFNDRDQWRYVQVEQISAANLGGEPFDLEAFWNNPNPKIFRSDEIIRASEPFDVDEFNRIIREGRDV